MDVAESGLFNSYFVSRFCREFVISVFYGIGKHADCVAVIFLENFSHHR